MIKLTFPLILASKSPARKELLHLLGVPFDIMPSNFEEPLHSSVLTHPEQFAQHLALEKGKEVLSRLQRKAIVLSADTIGVIDHEVLEKPADRDHAKAMMKKLSGKTHQVLTAIAVFFPDRENPVCKTVTTNVTFHDLQEEEIEHYLDQEEYHEKAGAYAIQKTASLFVKEIQGDFFNIVGLPVSAVYQILKAVDGSQKNL